MTKLGEITCCKDCTPPKRHAACWDTCPEYLEQKKAREEYLEKVRQGRQEQRAGVSERTLTHTHRNGKQIKKGQP